MNITAKTIEKGETGNRQMPVDNNQTSTSTEQTNFGFFEFEVSKTAAMKLLYASPTSTPIYFGEEESLLIEDVYTIPNMIRPDDIPRLFNSIENSSQTLEDVTVEYRIIQND